MDSFKITSGNVIKDLTPKHQVHDGPAPEFIDWSPRCLGPLGLENSGDEAALVVSVGMNNSINEGSSIRRTSPSSVRNTTASPESSTGVTTDLKSTMATHIDHPTKTLGRFKETDINSKTGDFFTKEDCDNYQRILAAKPKSRGGRRGATAKRLAAEKARAISTNGRRQQWEAPLPAPASGSDYEDRRILGMMDSMGLGQAQESIEGAETQSDIGKSFRLLFSRDPADSI